MSKYTNWDETPTILTVEETARLLRVHENTVLAMLRDGRLTGWKVGKFWRISRDAIKDKLEGGQ